MGLFSKAVLAAMRDELEKIAVAKIADDYVRDFLEKTAYSPRYKPSRPKVESPTLNVKQAPGKAPVLKPSKAPAPHPGGKAFDRPSGGGAIMPTNVTKGPRKGKPTRGGALGPGIEGQITKNFARKSRTARDRQSRYVDTSKPKGFRGPGELLMRSAASHRPSPSGSLKLSLPGSSPKPSPYRLLPTPLSGTKTTPGGYQAQPRVMGQAAPKVLNRPTAPTHTPTSALPHRFSGLIKGPQLNFKPITPGMPQTSLTGLPKVAPIKFGSQAGTVKPPKPPVFNPFGQKPTGFLPFSPTGQGNLFRYNY